MTYRRDRSSERKTMNSRQLCLSASLCFALTSSSPAASIIDGYGSTLNGIPDPVYDRFADHDSFIATGLDLSGVGRSANRRWATLVHKQAVLSAKHYAPGGTITFHLSNSPTGPTVIRNITDSLPVANTDLVVSILDSPVPAGVAVYEIASRNGFQAPLTLGGWLGESFVMIGRSPAGNVDSVANTDFSVGLNVADDSRLLNLNTTTTASVGYRDDSVAGDLHGTTTGGNFLGGPGEIYFQVGDSGAPTFFRHNGRLKLFGVHLGVNDNPSHVDRRISFDSFVPEYRDEIFRSISQLLPEPNAIWLLTSAVALILSTSRRRRSVEPRPRCLPESRPPRHAHAPASVRRIN